MSGMKATKLQQRGHNLAQEVASCWNGGGYDGPSGSGGSWFLRWPPAGLRPPSARAQEGQLGTRSELSFSRVSSFPGTGGQVGGSFSPFPRLMMMVMMLQESGSETARRVAEESSQRRVAHHREQRLLVGLRIAAHERGQILPATADGVCGSGVGDRGVRAFFLGRALLILFSQRRRAGLPPH